MANMNAVELNEIEGYWLSGGDRNGDYARKLISLASRKVFEQAAQFEHGDIDQGPQNLHILNAHQISSRSLQPFNNITRRWTEGAAN